MDVSKRIIQLREERGMSQYALWKASGVPQSGLSVYEAGKKSPGIDVLERICKGLNVSLAEFFNIEIEMPPDDRAARMLADEAKRLGAIREDGSINEEALNRIIRFLRSGSELIGEPTQDSK